MQPRGKPFRLFGPAAAWYLRDILDGNSLPDGWAMGQGLQARTRNIAFKTGTSYGYRDAWAVGFSNDYTVGVWVGRPDGAPRAGHVGRDDAGADPAEDVRSVAARPARTRRRRPADAIVAANAVATAAGACAPSRGTPKSRRPCAFATCSRPRSPFRPTARW